MQTFLSLTVSGLATAAIYAIAASGLVLTYTTTGVFNFAHGAIGMIAAFCYWQLTVGWGVPTAVALVAVVAVGAPLCGVVADRTIMRRLDATSDAIKAVVTIALMLGLLGLSVALWSPTVGRPVSNLFAGRVIELGGVRIPWHQIVSMTTALAVAVCLKLILNATRIGVAMRAAVDNRSLAALNGANPAAASMLAWAIGCGLAALSGILIAPTLTLSAVPLTLMIVNAYGAAIFGRLSSLPLTFTGATILGLSTNYAIGYLPKLPADVQPFLRGLVDALPAIVLLVVLLAIPSGRLRGVVTTREFAPKPTWAGSLALLAAVVGIAFVAAPRLGVADVVTAGRIWGIAIIALSMVPLIGLSGQLSLCQLSLAAVGAVAYAHLGWTSPLGLVAAAAAAGAAGALIALPALRVSGIYVALATAAFAVICDRWFFRLPAFGDGGFQPFPGGNLPVIRPSFGGINATSHTAYFRYAAVVFAVVALGVVALRRSFVGSLLIAVKDGPAAAATCGINVRVAKVAVFAGSGAIAGIGGATLSAASPTSTTTFDFVAGLPILMMMVICGIASSGAAVATGLFLGSTLLTGGIAGFERWQNVAIGFAGLLLGAHPNGLAPLLRRAASLVARTRPSGSAAASPADGVDDGETPPELVGLFGPARPNEVARLDERLGLADRHAIEVAGRVS